MKKIAISIFIFLLAMCATTTSQADSDPIENAWNGTWESEYYILLIYQNGTAISGSYEPKDSTLYDPGLLKGMLSEDGKTFSGIWTESGPLSVVLSDDGMSISGSYGIRIDKKLTESDMYPTTRTRMEDSFDPENPWNGTWRGERTITTWIQNGTFVSGTYSPLPDIDDEPGISEGTVSGDGNSLKGKWIEAGNFSFTLDDDLMAFTGTYDITLNDPTGTDTWNGKKIM
ncbi:MAG: hypothetical protein GXY48_08625 [Methanomicrobiales archaeon]|nr:hypothetical protein [Methanomicrobiales archaeon]